jgi:hypothetical protein
MREGTAARQTGKGEERGGGRGGVPVLDEDGLAAPFDGQHLALKERKAGREGEGGSRRRALGMLPMSTSTEARARTWRVDEEMN